MIGAKFSRAPTIPGAWGAAATSESSPRPLPAPCWASQERTSLAAAGSARDDRAAQGSPRSHVDSYRRQILQTLRFQNCRAPLDDIHAPHGGYQSEGTGREDLRRTTVLILLNRQGLTMLQNQPQETRTLVRLSSMFPCGRAGVIRANSYDANDRLGDVASRPAPEQLDQAGDGRPKRAHPNQRDRSESKTPTAAPWGAIITQILSATFSRSASSLSSSTSVIRRGPQGIRRQNASGDGRDRAWEVAQRELGGGPITGCEAQTETQPRSPITRVRKEGAKGGN
jgi:hypothetical protein